MKPMLWRVPSSGGPGLPSPAISQKSDAIIKGSSGGGFRGGGSVGSLRRALVPFFFFFFFFFWGGGGGGGGACLGGNRTDFLTVFTGAYRSRCRSSCRAWFRWSRWQLGHQSELGESEMFHQCDGSAVVGEDDAAGFAHVAVSAFVKQSGQCEGARSPALPMPERCNRRNR